MTPRKPVRVRKARHSGACSKAALEKYDRVPEPSASA